MVALTALAVLAVALVAARLGPLAQAHREARPDSRPAGSRSARPITGSARPGWPARATTRKRSWKPSGGSPGSSKSAGCSAPGWAGPRTRSPPRPGWRCPAEAAALHDAARLFDDICYGERPGTADGYALVQSLDSRLQSARPAEPSTSDAA